ncbi:MAG: glycosyltransferase family 4 protein [Deltaproteobacteria bacterium]|nr:glycosyltransferase family 4 protein [Deltaproteobacteria bacterium]
MKTSKNVLLMTPTYPPEIKSASLMMQELAHDLAAEGHDVTVLTTQPPLIHEGKARLASRRITSVQEGNVRVIRLPIPFLNLSGRFLRAFSYLATTVSFLIFILFRPKTEVHIVYSTPFFLGIVATLVKKLRGIPYIFNLHDLFPKNVIDLGLLRNKKLILLFDKMANKTYRESAFTTVYSEAHRHYVSQQVGRPEAVVTMPDWIDLAPYNGLPREQKNNGKIRVAYTGVIGFIQDLTTFIDAAKELENEPFEFWIVGDGINRKTLLDHAKNRHVRNVIFSPFVPLREFPKLLGTMDIAFASFKKEYRAPTIPAKMLGYMAAHLPLIGAFSHEDPQHLIRSANCGFCIPPEEVKPLVEVIRKLRDPALRKELGNNGRKYVEQFHSRSVCTKKFSELVRSASI